MVSKLKRIWKAAPLATALLLAALAVTVFFAVRLTLGWIYWADPAHRDQQIADWMTPRYVALSWQVPPEVVAEALGLSPHQGRPQSLEAIAQARGERPEALIQAIEAAIARYRAEGGA